MAALSAAHRGGAACFLSCRLMLVLYIFCWFFFFIVVGTCCYLKPIPNLPVSLLPLSQFMSWHSPCLPICLVVRVLGHNLIIFSFACPLVSFAPSCLETGQHVSLVSGGVRKRWCSLLFCMESLPGCFHSQIWKCSFSWLQFQGLNFVHIKICAHHASEQTKVILFWTRILRDDLRYLSFYTLHLFLIHLCLEKPLKFK